jgi:hypothetical protein
LNPPTSITTQSTATETFAPHRLFSRKVRGLPRLVARDSAEQRPRPLCLPLRQYENANTLYYREAGQSVVVVSEPLDGEHDCWKPVPPGHVVVAKAGAPVELAGSRSRNASSKVDGVLARVLQ